MMSFPRALRPLCAFLLLLPASSAAQEARNTPPSTAAAGLATPADYVLGIDDVVGVVFWRDADMSGDFVVRPDGKISLPLLNEVQAAGLTPEQLRAALLERAKKFVEDPTVTVVVRTINSRKIFVMGQVTRPGPYPLTSPTTVLQALALAGGLNDYADEKNIRISRIDTNGQPVSLKFNYEDVRKGKKLEQNVLLRVGDTIIVP